MRPVEDDGFRTHVDEEADAALAEQLSRALTAHNMAATGVDKERSFSVRIDAEDGSLVAGRRCGRRRCTALSRLPAPEGGAGVV